MGREEQAEEREVLDSIFPDEITDLSEDSFRVSIVLDVQQEDDDDTPPPTILLTLSFPEAYPEVAPNLNLSSPHNAPKHSLIDVSEDGASLLASLEPTIQDNLGMQMIFTLITTLKESAETLIVDRQEAKQAVKDNEARKAEEAENAKFQGEAVTRESFLKWREEWKRKLQEDQRRQEEKEEEARKKKAGAAGKVEERLTGRQLWERGLVGKYEEEDEEELEEGVAALKVES